MKFATIFALVAAASAMKQKTAHACDLVETDGSEIDTSLAVQLDAKVSDEVNVEQFTALAAKLEVELTPELLSLGSNEAVSNALIEIALQTGKSEADIEKAMGA